jgi:sodium-dependent dicarboxylate transporter 2/3/5
MLPKAGYIVGPGLFLLVLIWPSAQLFNTIAEQSLRGVSINVTDIQAHAWSVRVVLGLLLWMVTWWVTEAVPIPATALLPGIMLPAFHVIGVHGTEPFFFTPVHALRGYAHPIIFLFLGGFLIAAAIQKSGLDRRITLWILTRGNLANSSRGVLFGLMAASAFLSMWISNTATTAMMLPIGLGILRRLNVHPGKSNYGKSMMLGIAWAASIGGIGTIIGSPPNGIAVSILASQNLGPISFLDWMKVGVPLVVSFVPLAWWLLTYRLRPEVRQIAGGKEELEKERRGLGPFSTGEKAATFTFCLAVGLWCTNPFWPRLLPQAACAKIGWIDEYIIALGIGVLLFCIPIDWKNRTFLLEWVDTKFVHWGTLLLFGGGIVLSGALFKTGLAAWIGTSFIGLFGNPSTLFMLVIIIFPVTLMTEVTSNTAVSTMMVPIVISIALSTGNDPVALSLAAAIAASLAFMLPVATPPNALVYGTGYVRIADMIRVGVILEILGFILVVVTVYLFGDWLFGR